jgi:Ras-related protein Rab-28
MGHLRAVKPQKHKEFADAHGMASFFVSAKTGDNVNAMFFRLSADLAGVELTKPDMVAAGKVVAATLINHPQHDPQVSAPPVGAAAAAAAPSAGGGKGGKCSIQ